MALGDREEIPEFNSSCSADAQLLGPHRRGTELDKAIKLLEEIRLIHLRRSREAVAVMSHARAGSGRSPSPRR